MRYYVYILKSKKDEKYYIGQTVNLYERMNAHQRGSVKSTKNRRPLEMVYAENVKSYKEAINRESYFKRYKDTNKLLEVIKMAASSNGCDTPASRGDLVNSGPIV